MTQCDSHFTIPTCQLQTQTLCCKSATKISQRSSPAQPSSSLGPGHHSSQPIQSHPLWTEFSVFLREEAKSLSSAVGAAATTTSCWKVDSTRSTDPRSCGTDGAASKGMGHYDPWKCHRQESVTFELEANPIHSYENWLPWHQNVSLSFFHVDFEANCQRPSSISPTNITQPSR